MNPNPDIVDRHRFFRYAVPGEPPECELRFRDKRLTVLLLDKSAGGFGICCQQTPEVPVGDKGLFRVGEDWFEVQLVYVRTMGEESAGDGENPTANYMEHELSPFLPPCMQSTNGEQGESATTTIPSAPPIYRLGLCRLGDTFDPDIKPAYYSLAGLSCGLSHIPTTGWGIFVLGAVLVMAAVMVPITGMQFISSDSNDAEVKKGVRWLARSLPISSKTKPTMRPKGDLADTTGGSLMNAFAQGTKKTDATHKDSPVLYDKIGEMQKTILQSPMPFSLPEVVQQLQLTESQQKRIRDLTDAATTLIKNLGGSADKRPGGGENLIEKNILDSTRNRVLELLDDGQKKKWRELSGEPEDPQKNGEPQSGLRSP